MVVPGTRTSGVSSARTPVAGNSQAQLIATFARDGVACCCPFSKSWSGSLLAMLGGHVDLPRALKPTQTFSSSSTAHARTAWAAH